MINISEILFHRKLHNTGALSIGVNTDQSEQSKLSTHLLIASIYLIIPLKQIHAQRSLIIIQISLICQKGIFYSTVQREYQRFYMPHLALPYLLIHRRKLKFSDLNCSKIFILDYHCILCCTGLLNDCGNHDFINLF